MEQSPIPLLCLSDGHAGNRRQAEALARMLGFAEPPHVTLAPSWGARRFAPRRFPFATRAFGAAFEALLAAPPALAIGCGRQAALATRLLRDAGSRVVQILDPRLDPRHWDALVVPAHDPLRGANVIALHGSLHPVDDLWLARARADFPVLGGLPSPRVAVLIGGPGKHWPMDDAGFGHALSALSTRVHAQGGSLLLSASRRTPDAWRDVMAAQPAALCWRDERDGANPYPGLLGWADAIVCTADSVNMLSEACATAVPVWVIGGDALQGRPRVFLDHLRDAGRVRDLDGRDANESACASAFDTSSIDLTPVTPLRETARVAARLKDMLGL